MTNYTYEEKKMTDTIDDVIIDIEDGSFDHIAAAKEDLADVVTTGRLDYTSAIAAATAHALISIAQSLDILAGGGLDFDGLALTEDFEVYPDLEPANVFNLSVVPRAAAAYSDFYREG